jgi:hypothetical protein
MAVKQEGQSGFVLSDKAIEYFKSVELRKDKGPTFKVMFDVYYLCLMMGLFHRRQGSQEQISKPIFIDYYPEVYRDKSDLIAGLLIDAEMERKGIRDTDRSSVEKLMLNLIDHMSITKLSSQGMRILNLYAAGGINYIHENITNTQELEVFLIKYYQLLNNAHAS